MIHPKHQPKRELLRVDIDGNDVDLLEMLIERIKKLEQIEDILDSRMAHAVGFLDSDWPHVTKEGRELLEKIIDPWTIKPGEEMFWVEEESEVDE